MWKLGLRPRYSFSGIICFEISVFCLCSVHLAPFEQQATRSSADYIFLSVMGVGGGGWHRLLPVCNVHGDLQNAGCYLEDLEEGGSHSPFTSPASWTSPVPAHGTSPVPAHGTSPAPDLDLSGPAPDEGDRLWQLTGRETSANLQERTRTSQGTKRSLKR
jgi:hypothetical protein